VVKKQKHLRSFGALDTAPDLGIREEKRLLLPFCCFRFPINIAYIYIYIYTNTYTHTHTHNIYRYTAYTYRSRKAL
jgi:hypothetical protein